MHASGPSELDSVAYPLLIDTLYFVIDGISRGIFSAQHSLTCILAEIHSQTKSSTHDLFKYYPSISEHELPTEIPSEYYRQLCTLLPHLPPNEVVANLVHAHRDASGQLVYGAPVQNRPWEWVENLGEPAVEEDAYRWREGPFKNASSLSLELFAAHRTGEHIPRPNLIHDTPTQHDDDESKLRLEGDVRSFEDGLSAESIYRRDWRETRLEAYRNGQVDCARSSMGKVEALDEVGSLPVFTAQNRSGSTGAGSRKASPASSVKSRGSVQGTVSSVRQSPGSTNKMSTATVSDAMEEGSTMMGSGGVCKRKPDSDDEVEVVEGPLPIKAGIKKAKSVKARGKKR